MREKITNVEEMRRVLKSERSMRKYAEGMIYKGLIVAFVMYGSYVWCECRR